MIARSSLCGLDAARSVAHHLGLMADPYLIKGREVADKVYQDVANQLESLKAHGHVPGLAVVLVGNNPASRSYVRAKDRMCRKLGLHSLKIEMPEETTQGELLAKIDELNADPAIHGILVQSPPPPHINEGAIVERIAPEKDVDGFHTTNLGKLVLGDPTGFAPCTPLGCRRMLMESGNDPAGKHVVILGRSKLVGKPLALLLQQKAPGGNATVTIAHSRSENLEELTRSADILVAAIGVREFIKADHVKEGAVVLDVGINQVDDPSREKGYRLVGDVAFDEVAPKCRAITPVPGGVGPMTIAMLMSNTVQACGNSLD